MPAERNSTDTDDQGSLSGPQLKEKACERCRGRKTRCDHLKPCCSSCLKAKAQCIYILTGRDATVAVLEQHIRALEDRLQAIEKIQPLPVTRTNNDPEPLPVVHTGVATGADKSLELVELGPDASSSIEPDDWSRFTIPESVQANRSSGVRVAPRTTGSPSTPFALPLGPRLNAPPSTSQLLSRIPILHSLNSISRSQNTTAGASYEWGSESASSSDLRLERSRLPGATELGALVGSYVSYCNRAFGFLHEPTLWEQVRTVETATRVSRFDLFVVNMVVAIALSYQTRVHHPDSHYRGEAYRYFSQASEHAAYSVSLPDHRRLQAMHLILHYFLQHPEVGDVWQMAGLAIRTAVDMGYHHEKTITMRDGKIVDPVSLDLRRRLFWNTYCVDINLSTILGRPPSIPEDWIRVERPLLQSDDALSVDTVIPGEPASCKLVFNHYIDLRQIQSSIHRTLYSETASQRTCDSLWLEGMQERVEVWRASQPEVSPDSESFINQPWLDLNYHLTVCLLNRPCPGNPAPDQAAVGRAMRSSRQTMRTLKMNYRNNTINYPWMAINHLFMSGVTLLSCLLLQGPMGTMPPLLDAMLDVQACASVLEALTNIQPGTRHISDAFEQVSAAVIAIISNSDPRPTGIQMTSDEGDNPTIPTAQKSDQWALPTLSTSMSGTGIGSGAADQAAWDALQSILLEPTSISVRSLGEDNQTRPDPGFGSDWNFEFSQYSSAPQ